MPRRKDSSYLASATNTQENTNMTIADDRLNEAIQRSREAREALSAIVADNCSGSEKLSDTFRRALCSAHLDLTLAIHSMERK
jgi:hypothetical protein